MKKNQIGVWLDSREALIVRLNENEPKVEPISSDIDTSEAKGGSGTGGTPWGPQIGVSESAWLERRKHAEKDFFEVIQGAVEEAEDLYILGPGELKKHFAKFLEGNKSFKPTVMEVATADSMTPNQLVAHVKQFFENGN